MKEFNQQKKKPLFALVLTGWPYALLFVLILWYLVIFDLHFLCGLLFLFGIISPIAAYLLKRYAGVDYWNFPRRLFIFVSLMGLAAIFHPSFIVSPFFTSFMAIAASVIAFANLNGKPRAYLACCFTLGIFWVFAEGFSRMIAVLLITFTLFFLLVASRKTHWIQKGFTLFILLCTLAFGSVLYIFYKALPPDNSGQILAQKGVSAVFLSHDPNSPVSKAVGSECRIIRENCDGSLLLGTRKKKSGLLLLKNGKIIPTKIKAISDYIETDCKKKIIWAGEFKKSRILGIHSETGKTLKRIKSIGIPGSSRIRYISQIGQLFASRDDYRKIFRYDVEKGERFIQTFDHFILDFAISTELDALFVSRWGGVLHRYSLGKAEKLETFFSPDWLIQFEIDDSNLLVYITKFYAGRVLMLNLSTLEIIDTRKLAPGIRYPLLDKKRNLLFVSNFFTGDCHMMDAKTLEVLDSRNFGKRLRATTLSESGKRLYAASSQGGFIWQID